MTSAITEAPIGKREARKAERRAAIIAIANTHFLEQGYDRTSMSAIVEEMGGSKGTLWSYFASKEELFAAVLDEATAAFRETMLATLDPAGDLITVLTGLAEKFIVRISDPDAVALQRLIIGEVERFPEIGRIFYDRAPAVSRVLLSTFLTGQMEAGVIEKGDAWEAAEMFFDLCAGGYHQRILWGLDARDAATPNREAARVIQQFLRCYPRTLASNS